MTHLVERQHAHLQSVIRWARSVREHLSDIQGRHAGSVHFRPSSGGVAMIGLLQERPLRGESRYKNLSRLAADFDKEFEHHCRSIDQGRPTPEKRLQAFLIAEAYQNDRLMTSIKAATDRTEDPAELLFATDELAIPIENDERIVCDILALRRSGAGHFRPVIVELKSKRQKTRLVEQVSSYASLIEAHRHLFAELFTVLLNREVELETDCEKWIVWPALPSGAEPREEELAKEGIRVVSYVQRDDGFDFQAYRAP